MGAFTQSNTSVKEQLGLFVGSRLIYLGELMCRDFYSNNRTKVLAETSHINIDEKFNLQSGFCWLQTETQSFID